MPIMNRQTLDEIISNGKYGRKIAYTNYEYVNESNVLEVISNTIGTFWYNRRIAQYLWDYKNGDQPILYRQKKVRPEINNKITENHAYEFCAYAVAQTYGEPIQYVRRNKGKSNEDDERLDRGVDELNRIMHIAMKDVKNVAQGEWMVATGTSFLALRRTKNPVKPLAITVPTPLNTYMVYSSITEEPVLAVQMLKNSDNEQYYRCWTDTYIFTVQDGKILDKRLHAFKAIPIVEIPNNQDRISDIELVICLLDAINNMQANRMDGVEQFVQSWIKFINCDVDKDTFDKMRITGALVVKSNNGTDNKADVDVISTELNQTESQVAKEDLLANAQMILAIPSRQENASGDTGSAVKSRNGFDVARMRAGIRDSYVIEGEMRFAEVALNALEIDGLNLGVNITDFDVQVSHTPTDNLLVKAEAMEMLFRIGIHPMLVFKQCGLFQDPEKAYNLSKPYLDMKYANAENDSSVASLNAFMDVFNKMLSAGISPDEAIKKIGIDPSIVSNSPSMAKWDYEPNDTVEIIE